MLEQPCDKVRRTTGIVRKLDESVLRQARDLSTQRGIMMVIEDTLRSDITIVVLRHLAVSTLSIPPKYVLNCCYLSGDITPNIAPDGSTQEDASLSPNDTIDLRIIPDKRVLDETICVIKWLKL